MTGFYSKLSGGKEPNLSCQDVVGRRCHVPARDFAAKLFKLQLASRRPMGRAYSLVQLPRSSMQNLELSRGCHVDSKYLSEDKHFKLYTSKLMRPG